jgi:hypothetical protein
VSASRFTSVVRDQASATTEPTSVPIAISAGVPGMVARSIRLPSATKRRRWEAGRCWLRRPFQPSAPRAPICTVVRRRAADGGLRHHRDSAVILSSIALSRFPYWDTSAARHVAVAMYPRPASALYACHWVTGSPPSGRHEYART